MIIDIQSEVKIYRNSESPIAVVGYCLRPQKSWKFLLFFAAIALSFPFTSCRKYLEIEVPENKVLQSAAFATDENANATMLGVYGQMVNNSADPFALAYRLGLVSDELTGYSVGFAPLYRNLYNATNSGTEVIWNSAYNFIYQTNAVIDGCHNATGLSSAVAKQLIAEALFIRAYWHFYLCNLYGEVPVVSTPNYEINALIRPSPVTEVYKQIISDLNIAVRDLNENYVDASAVNVSSERIRPCRYTANALLARVYLHTGDFKSAEQQAAKVIDNSSVYSIPENLDAVFITNSKESIWQIRATTPGDYQNTSEGRGFILMSSPSASQQQSVSPQLLASLNDTDLRRLNWLNVFRDESTNPAKDYYYPFKYKLNSGNVPLESSTLFRLAEQYLIRSESAAEQGELDLAIKDVDVIKKRAGLPLIQETNPGISKEELLNEIMLERQRELFTEQGLRWLDLKRTGRVDEVMAGVAPLKGGSWTTEKQFFPVPQTELLNNPNMKQTPGYN
jgi:starch-binding outer membrane protein, SusD/RagB family